MSELTKEQEEYANKLFKLRRRIYDRSNIKDNYYYMEIDFCNLSEEVDLEGLSDNDKFILVIIIYDMRDYGVCSHVFKSSFGWDKKKVYAIAKEEMFVHSESLFREDDGLIVGKGYVIDQYVKTRMEDLYNEFLWHDILEDPPKNKYLLLDIDDSAYKGRTKGILLNGVFHVYRPEYAKYTEWPNWPKEDNGWSYKNEISVNKENIKRWRFLY